MVYLGREGSIQHDGHAADTLMNCLNDLDGGEFNENLFASVQASQTVEPVALAFPQTEHFSETKCPHCDTKFYIEREAAPVPE